MYAVRFVREDQLPGGLDWVLTQDEDSNICALFIKESAVCPEVLAEAWVGYVYMAEQPQIPAQRRARLC